MAGLVSGLSSLWIVGHIFVLLNTSEHGLKLQRYVDIFSGICMLSSHGCLGLGSTRKNSQFVGLYFTLTFGLVIIYWLWFIYLKYGICETEASKEVVFQYQYP